MVDNVLSGGVLHGESARYRLPLVLEKVFPVGAYATGRFIREKGANITRRDSCRRFRYRGV